MIACTMSRMSFWRWIDIALHNAESLELFLADWINFSDDLVDALNAMRDKMSPCSKFTQNIRQPTGCRTL